MADLDPETQPWATLQSCGELHCPLTRGSCHLRRCQGRCEDRPLLVPQSWAATADRFVTSSIAAAATSPTEIASIADLSSDPVCPTLLLRRSARRQRGFIGSTVATRWRGRDYSTVPSAWHLRTTSARGSAPSGWEEQGRGRGLCQLATTALDAITPRGCQDPFVLAILCESLVVGARLRVSGYLVSLVIDRSLRPGGGLPSAYSRVDRQRKSVAVFAHR
jgi:hypothetical protein